MKTGACLHACFCQGFVSFFSDFFFFAPSGCSRIPSRGVLSSRVLGWGPCVRSKAELIDSRTGQVETRQKLPICPFPLYTLHLTDMSRNGLSRHPQGIRPLSKLPTVSQSSEIPVDTSSVEAGFDFDGSEHDDDDDQSIHFPDPATYRRFLLFHILALIPTAAFLIACIAASWQVRSLCRLGTTSSTKYSHRRESCRILLDDQLMVTCFLLGSITWLASYACRRASWHLSSFIIPYCFSASRTTGFETSSAERAVTFTAISLQSLSTEGLRLISFYLVGCVLIAARAMKSFHPQPSLLEAQNGLPRWAWRLSFRDPRFCCALWASLACEWSSMTRRISLQEPYALTIGEFDLIPLGATCEFAFGSIQIIHQVGLYKPTSSERPPENASSTFHQEVRPTSSPEFSSELSSFRPRRISEERQVPNERTGLKRGSGHDVTLGSSSGRNESHYGAMHDSNVQRRTYQIDSERSDPITEPEDQTDTETISDLSRDLELEQRLEDEVEELLLTKERAELESVLGVSLPEIPIALCMLWRIDAMLWCIGSGVSPPYFCLFRLTFPKKLT